MSAVVKIFAGLALIALGIFLAPFTGGLSLQLVGIGATLVLSGIMQLIAGKPKTKNEVSKINVRIAEPVRWLTAGITRQGGAVLFAEFDGAGNLWYLVVHNDCMLVETIQYLLDDVPVTLDGSGFVTTNDFCLTSKKEPYEGTGVKVPYIQIWTTTHTAANLTPPAVAALAAAFPGKWTGDHKLVGTTYTVVKMNALENDHRYKIYKWRGAIGLGEPSISLVGKWSNCYDPREIAQSVSNATTHEFSRNSVLVWAWFRMHRYGRNKHHSSINWVRVAEQAAICDQMVVGIDGEHKRYQCDIAVAEDKPRAECEQEILMTMDAQLVFDDDGKCWPRAGYYYAPTLALSRNRDILAMESIEAQNGESETQGVIVRYTEPAAKYVTQPSAPWINPNYYVEGQSTQFLTVDILACTDHNQAVRLAKAIGMRSQPLHKIAPSVGLRGLKTRQERIININYDNIFAGDYEINSQVEIDNGGFICAFIATPVGDHWNLVSGEEKPKPVVDGTETVIGLAAPANIVATFNNDVIGVTYDPLERVDVYAQFQYIVTADIAGDRWLSMAIDPENLYAYTPGVDTTLDYSIRGRCVSTSGRVSAWSTIVELDGTPADVDYDGGDATTEV